MAEPSIANRTGPLRGVRVLDLSRLVAGNTLTQLLADFGADVTKVEPLAGDTLRAWKIEGVSTHWKVYARSKKSLALNFRHPGAGDLLRRLASTADVFIESFRPGTLETMGLAPDTLLAANPRLVILRISGWGQDGPYRRRPGFGTLAEGMSGFASMNGFEDREPLLPPSYLADSVAGLYGASAVLMALREVEVSGGRGQVIDVALPEPLFAILGPQAANYKLTGEVKPRTGNRSTNSAPRNVYPTSDGKYVCLSASTQGMAERLMRAVGGDDLVQDARFRTNADRLANVEALDDAIRGFISRKTLAENVDFFEQAEVTIGPIYDISQIVEDPHFRARGLVQDYPDDEMGSIPMNAVVPRLSGTPGAFHSPAPRLGENGAEVLAAYGIGQEAIDTLIEHGVVSLQPDAASTGEGE